MDKYDVAIIGCGFSGLLCANYLREAGVENFCIIEMNTNLGGVWSHGGVGSYPGAACDVPSYTYLPFLDRTGFIPSKKYVSQSEIADYAEMLADHCQVREKIIFSTKVVGVAYQDIGDWELSTWNVQRIALANRFEPCMLFVPTDLFPVPVCLRCRVCHHLREKVSTQLSGIVRPI